MRKTYINQVARQVSASPAKQYTRQAATFGPYRGNAAGRVYCFVGP